MASSEESVHAASDTAPAPSSTEPVLSTPNFDDPGKVVRTRTCQVAGFEITHTPAVSCVGVAPRHTLTPVALACQPPPLSLRTPSKMHSHTHTPACPSLQRTGWSATRTWPPFER